MKILTQKQVDEILKRITANEIICVKCVKDIEVFEKIIGNNAEITYMVGGFKGMDKVKRGVSDYIKGCEV